MPRIKYGQLTLLHSSLLVAGRSKAVTGRFSRLVVVSSFTLTSIVLVIVHTVQCSLNCSDEDTFCQICRTLLLVLLPKAFI